MAIRASLCRQCRDERISSKIIAGILEEETRTKLLELVNPMLQEVKNLCIKREVVAKNTSEMKSKKAQQAAIGNASGRGGRQSGRGRGGGPDLSRAISKTTQSADNVVTPTDPRNPRAKSVDTVRKSATLNPSVEAEKSEREQRDEKEKEKARTHFDEKAKSLTELPIGTRVFIQDVRSKKWSTTSEVIAKGERRSYDVRLDNGKVWTRNRRFLRPKTIRFDDEPTPRSGSPTPSPIRKSSRHKRSPQRFGSS